LHALRHRRNRVHQPPLKVAYKPLKAGCDVRLRHVDVIALRYAG